MNMQLILFLSLFSLITQAQVISWEEHDVSHFESGEYEFGGMHERGHIYVIPNEIHPEESLPILQKVPEGIYLSVGAERGFINFSLALNATHLLMVDLVPQVVFFNQINIALLKLSENLDDYLSLRQAQSHEVWLKRLRNCSLSSEEKRRLMTDENFETFKTIQVRPTRRLLAPELFKNTSYLRENIQYLRLKKAADEGRIQAIQGNLRNADFLSAVAAKIKQVGLKVGALDISNAWERRYTGSEGVYRVVQSFRQVLTDSSLLVVSIMRYTLGENIHIWDYSGFRISALEKIRDFFKTKTSYTSAAYDQRFFPSGTVVEPAAVSEEYLRYLSETESQARSQKLMCSKLFEDSN